MLMDKLQQMGMKKGTGTLVACPTQRLNIMCGDEQRGVILRKQDDEVEESLEDLDEELEDDLLALAAEEPL